MIYTAIAICEVAFWGFLAAGLATRYLLNLRRSSTILLLGSPVADLILLALVGVDLHRGATPTQAHALAATYLGFTVAFGPRVVRWADGRFAHWFAGGPPVTAPSRDVHRRAASEWRLFFDAALAWTVACTILLGMSALVGDFDRAQPLLSYIVILTTILAVWFITGPVWATINRLPSRKGNPAISTRVDTGPLHHLRSAQGGRNMEQQSRQKTTNRWAPWWVYLLVIVGANYLRQVIMPFGTVPEWSVVLIVLGMSAALFFGSTAIYRALAGAGRRAENEVAHCSG